MIIVFLSKNIEYDSRTSRILSVLEEDCEIEIFELNTYIKKFRNKFLGILFFISLPFQIRFSGKSPRWAYAAGLRGLPLAVLSKFLLGTKIIYDSREVYLNDANGISNYKAYHRFLEEKLIHFSDLILSANQERLELTISTYQLRKPSFSILNLVNSDFPVQEYKLKNGKNIIYQGTIGSSRHLQKIIEASLAIKGTHFFLVTEIENLKHLYSKNQNYINEGRLTIYPMMKLECLFKLIQKMDLGIVSYSLSGLNNYLCSPNKLFEYIYCGTPVICTPQPMLKNILSTYKVGCLFEKGINENSSIEKLSIEIDNALSSRYNFNDFISFHRDFNWKTRKAELKIFFSKHMNQK
jgi:glycosyltransferase involved in cell wall biosynthesis